MEKNGWYEEGPHGKSVVTVIPPLSPRGWRGPP